MDAERDCDSGGGGEITTRARRKRMRRGKGTDIHPIVRVVPYYSPAVAAQADMVHMQQILSQYLALFEYLRYNKIKFVCLSVPSNRPQFLSDLHQTWRAASP